MAKSSNPFTGKWRIVWMQQWDQDYVDEEAPGHFTFAAHGMGSFRFGCVQGGMDVRHRGDRADFSWCGMSEMTEVSGRGHAELKGDEMVGHIYFHLGDDSAFRAIRASSKVRK
jgi:hypothetical protein